MGPVQNLPEIELSELERSVLNLVADYQLAESEPAPLDHIVLSRPADNAEVLKATAVSLAKKGCLEFSGIGRFHLHLTPPGLLLSQRRPEADRFAELLLAFFKRRLKEQGVKFRRYQWTELREAGVVEGDERLPFAVVVIRTLDLYGDTGTWSKGPPAHGEWGVPNDVVYLRDASDVETLYVRGETRRRQRGTGSYDFLQAAVRTMEEQSQMPKHPKDVFVVHGRDTAVRDAVFDFLRSVGLNPMEWEEARRLTGKPSPYIGEILDAAFGRAQAVVVIFSGDDEARLRDKFHGPKEPSHEVSLTPQARANVLFEAGMAMGREPDRTVLLEVGDLRSFSDLAGRHAVRLHSGDAAERHVIVERLRTAGCEPVTDGKTDWLKRDYFAAVFKNPSVGPGAPVGAPGPSSSPPANFTFVPLDYAEKVGLGDALRRDGWELVWPLEDERSK